MRVATIGAAMLGLQGRKGSHPGLPYQKAGTGQTIVGCALANVCSSPMLSKENPGLPWHGQRLSRVSSGRLWSASRRVLPCRAHIMLSVMTSVLWAAQALYCMLLHPHC